MNAKLLVALIIAISLDLFDFLLIGLIPIFGDIFDIVGIVILFPLIKVYALLGVFELVPIIGDLSPTFTAAVLLSRTKLLGRLTKGEADA